MSQSRINPVSSFHMIKSFVPMDVVRKVSIPYQSGLKFPQLLLDFVIIWPMMSQSRINPVSSFHFPGHFGRVMMAMLSQSRINPVSSFHDDSWDFRRTSSEVVSIPYQSGLKFPLSLLKLVQGNRLRLSQSRINPVSSFHLL